VSHLPVTPSRQGAYRQPGWNGCFTKNRTGSQARGFGLTDKGRALLVRLELERVFGSEPLERGPTPISDDWRRSL
jgi:hypothetical protein